jgi:hydrogenase/urease accessory protein HupE
LQAVFQPGFHFEEPIALTIVQMPAQRRMTRWLVTSQTSPLFALDAPDGAAASAAAATSTPAADAATGRDAAPATTGATLAQFVRFGFLHILPRGLDHVLFVLGLFLGARSLKSLLLLVTCFTIAHSITLGLATLGIFRLPSGVVEPLIAASIAWIGIENLRGSARSERYRPFVVFGFGLLHGLGFASALAALDVPRGEFLASLLSFNVGIETGQLAVIAAAFLLTLPWRGGANWRRTIVRPASRLITLVALFWTVQRLVS